MISGHSTGSLAKHTQLIPKKDVFFGLWLLSLNVTFMYSFVASDWSEAMLKRPELVRPPLFLKDVCVGWGAHPWFRQVPSLPCLPVSAFQCLSSVHACSPTISAGYEDSLVSPGHVGGRQPGCSSCSVDLSLSGSLYFLSGFVAGWLIGPTEMASSDLLMVMLLNSIFPRWASVQLRLSGHEAVSVCGPRRAPTLTTREGGQ